jgi:ferredoxin like protein
MNEKPEHSMTAPTPVVSLDDKLALVKRKFDKESHIEVDQELFKKDPDKVVLFICPAKVYELNEETGECTVNFENCLECGTCQVAAREYVKWDNPQGGFGVCYGLG